MWSPIAYFNPATMEEGIVINHLDGNPPRSFKAVWPRGATVDDVLDAIADLGGELEDYQYELNKLRG